VTGPCCASSGSSPTESLSMSPQCNAHEGRSARAGRARHLATHRRSKPFVGIVLTTILSLAALVLSAAPASAHDVFLSGQTSCQVDGTWTVNWEAINNQPEPDHYMLVRAASVDAGPLQGVVANPTYQGIVDANHPDASQGGGTIVPPSGFGPLEFSSPGIPASQASITLTFTGFWSYPTPTGVTSVEVTESLTVDRPPECVDTRPGRIQIHKSVAGDGAPPGPFQFEVHGADSSVVTTVAVPANGDAVSVDIPPGVYTLVELNAPPGATITPNPVVVAPSATAVVQAVNTYATPPIEVEATPPVVLAPSQPATPVSGGLRFTG